MYFCPHQAKPGSAKGGPYVGVHLRRKDFIWGHRDDVPSLKGAVKKIRSLMKKHKIDTVFIATDADGDGNTQLCFNGYDLNTFSPLLLVRAIFFLNAICNDKWKVRKQFYYPVKFVWSCRTKGAEKIVAWHDSVWNIQRGLGAAQRWRSGHYWPVDLRSCKVFYLYF